MSDSKLSDDFPPIGPDPDLKWLARAMSAIHRSQVRTEEHQETASIAASNLADRVGHLEVVYSDTVARVDHIERSLVVPAEGRRRGRAMRWLMQLPASAVALIAFFVSIGALLLVVALAFRTRSS